MIHTGSEKASLEPGNIMAVGLNGAHEAKLNSSAVSSVSLQNEDSELVEDTPVIHYRLYRRRFVGLIGLVSADT